MQFFNSVKLAAAADNNVHMEYACVCVFIMCSQLDQNCRSGFFFLLFEIPIPILLERNRLLAYVLTYWANNVVYVFMCNSSKR